MCVCVCIHGYLLDTAVASVFFFFLLDCQLTRSTFCKHGTDKKLTMARRSKVSPLSDDRGRTKVCPWTLIFDPGAKSSSVPAASNRMTYCPANWFFRVKTIPPGV